MDPRKKFVSRRLKLAERKLKVSKLLLRHREYRDAISRAYYAMFYAAKAYLLAHGHDPSSHHGVKVLFHQLCSKGGELEPALAKMLTVVQEERIEAEYDEMSQFGLHDAKQAVNFAEEFIRKIKRLLR